MIEKRGNTYVLKSALVEDNIAIELNKETISIRKYWEKSQIFKDIIKYLGCVATNESLLKFARDEGKKYIQVKYIKGDKVGLIKMDINEWLIVGEEFHNERKHYDNQLILPRKFIQHYGDEVTQEILKEIFQEMKTEIEQRKKYGRNENKNEMSKM